MRFKTLPIFLALSLMGLADAMGPLSDGVRKQYALIGPMCMAISGGALIPLLMGWLLDLGWKEISFIVPAGYFIYLLLLSLRGKRSMAQSRLQVEG